MSKFKRNIATYIAHYCTLILFRTILKLEEQRLNLTYCWKSSLLLAFCFLFVGLIKLKFVLHRSHYQDCFRGPYVILRSWKGGRWSSELLGDFRPLFIPWEQGFIQALLLTSIFHGGSCFITVGHNPMCVSKLALAAGGS